MVVGSGGRENSVTEPEPRSGEVAGIIAAVGEMLETGAVLPSERQLADRLKVKRHQLRKALEFLRQSGRLAPGRARRVPDHPRYSEALLRVTNPLEVVELRLIMEPSFARLASLRASAPEIAEITAWATTPKETKPELADMNFHLAVATAARNHLAREIFTMLRHVGVDARMRVARVAPAAGPARIAERDGEHRLVAAAIAARDPEAAEAAMRAHLLLVQRRIVERSNAGLAAA